ncbi:MAG: hypothetical protein MPJ50_18550, partial [Pirellulales bacterium]|nr:hypothetical protein [Pirellulales bacterium]
LEQNGLLPPSRDVEQLLDVLRPRVRAWSGWEFISRTFPNGQRSIIEGSPELATGIIVHDADFDLAGELLRENEVALEDPVVVTTRKGFDSKSSTDQIVVGPQSDAFFDREAGTSERARRQTDLDQYDDQISSVTVRQKKLSDLERELRSFCDDHPVSWFSNIANQIEEKSHSEAEAVQRAADLLAQSGSMADQISDVESSLDDKRKDKQATHDAMQRAQGFVEQHESSIQTNESDLKDCTDEVEILEIEQLETQGMLETLEEQTQLCDTTLQRLRSKIAQDQLLLTQIEYRQSDEQQSPNGPLSQLADDYRQLKTQYEQNVGAQSLLQLVTEAEENAQRERKKFRENLDSEIAVQDVEQALVSLSDPEQAEAEQQAAQTGQSSAFSAYQTGRKALKAAERRRDETGKVCEDTGTALEIEAELKPDSVESAERAGDEADLAATELSAKSSEHRSNSEQANNDWAAAEAEGRRLHGLGERATTLSERHQRLLESLNDDQEAAPSPVESELPADVDKLEEYFRGLEKRLDGLSEQDVQLNRQRSKIVSGIRHWAGDPRFNELKTPLIHRVRGYDDADFERSFDHLNQLLELRQKTVDEKIAEIDENRELVVRQLQQVAEDGYAVLRSAANQSKLPESVPELAGHQFMTINMKWPEDHGEQRTRIGDLIDELVEKDDILNSTKLMQLAVRRLARPIRVRVLNPDPNHAGQRLDISELSKFSGGERLTCAVLLYCTLAQLRARQKGLFRKPSSVLLLDNPIGSASRVTFIKLQRDVARAMGIQLVYTTGVNDYEALQPIPKRIRLRNDRVNRRNGSKMVELMDDGAGDGMQPIQAIHVGEREQSLG